MEICDEINLEEKDEKIDNLFFLMMNGKSVTANIKTSRGDFKVNYPKQKGVISIGCLAALMRGGMPPSAIDASAEYEIQKCAALDVIIVSGPEWFEDAKKDTNFSWINMPDSRFADEVYAKVLSFCMAVREKLKGDTEQVSKGTTE
ncbi:MAG: hypothetical protein FWF68_04365 [Spirochaetes bacterium]|nr:hypothetical protein [Brevinematales bacterium]MCL1958814.1 hypothetical protein [Spirochaetota bacterium]